MIFILNLDEFFNALKNKYANIIDDYDYDDLKKTSEQYNKTLHFHEDILDLSYDIFRYCTEEEKRNILKECGILL